MVVSSTGVESGETSKKDWIMSLYSYGRGTNKRLSTHGHENEKGTDLTNKRVQEQLIENYVNSNSLPDYKRQFGKD